MDGSWECLRCALPCPECEGNHPYTGGPDKDPAHGELRHCRTWTLKFSHNGTLIYERTRTGDWNKAQAYRKRRFREVFGGDDPWGKARQTTLDEILNLVFSHYRKEGLKTLKRLEKSRKSLYTFPKFLKGAAVASTLTETVINDEYVDFRRMQGRKGKPLANGTINQELFLLRSAYRRAYMRRDEHGRRLISQPPVVQLLRPGAPREGFFVAASVQAMLTAVRNLDAQASPSDLADLIEFYWLIGWRSSAGKAIERTDIDWFSEEIVLRRVLSKNGEPVRIPFGADRELHALLKRREALAVSTEEEIGKKVPWLFFRTSPPWKRGEPIRNFYRAWDVALKAAGLPSEGKAKLTPHAFRRSAARDTVDAGVDPMLACDLVGWNTLEMLKRYRIVTKADRERALAQRAEYRRNQRAAAQMALPFVKRG